MKRQLKAEDSIDISDYLIQFLRELPSVRNYKKRGIRSTWEANHIKELANDSRNTEFKSTRSVQGDFFWAEQKVDFVPSNLGEGKGFVFYFLCNSCERRVKYLYYMSMISEPLCRTCCRLGYKQSTRKERSLSRLINRPYLSSEHKYLLMKEIGITREDIKGFLV